MNYERHRLPREIEAALPKALRKPLNHPIRRLILRALDGSGKRHSPSELVAAGAVPCSAAATSYHLQVMRGCGLVRSAGIEPAKANIKHYFTAKVARKGPIADALQCTEAIDRKLLRT